MAELKDILKKLRAEKNISQVDLANDIGAGVSTVAMWETGKRHPNREKLEALADYFNVDIDYLYGRTDIRQRAHFDPDGHMMVYLSDDEQRLLRLYRDHDRALELLVMLDPIDRDRIIERMDAYLEADKYKKAGENAAM